MTHPTWLVVAGCAAAALVWCPVVWGFWVRAREEWRRSAPVER